jgi:hypothetical protein
VAKFIINEINQTFLEDVFKLETEELFKYEWTQEIYLKKIEEQQIKLFASKNME